jgi:hypothetical protein
LLSTDGSLAPLQHRRVGARCVWEILRHPGTLCHTQPFPRHTSGEDVLRNTMPLVGSMLRVPTGSRKATTNPTTRECCHLSRRHMFLAPKAVGNLCLSPRHSDRVDAGSGNSSNARARASAIRLSSIISAITASQRRYQSLSCQWLCLVTALQRGWLMGRNQGSACPDAAQRHFMHGVSVRRWEHR